MLALGTVNITLFFQKAKFTQTIYEVYARLSYVNFITIFMKKQLLLTGVLFLVIILNLNAQALKKGNLLLNADMRITEFSPEMKVVPSIWEGPPINVSAYYVFYKNSVAAVSSGLHSTYFRHQPQDGHNYGTLGLSIPINVHFTALPKLDPYLGYRYGYYFDGYNPSEKNIIGYHTGTFSELYLGVRYFLLPRIGIYAEMAATEFELSAGVSFKL